MQEGLMKVQAKSLMEYFERKEIYPIDALNIMTNVSAGILTGMVEYDISAQDREQITAEYESFSKKLHEALRGSTEDIFSMLLATQVMYRDLVGMLAEDAEQLKEENKN